MQNWNLTVIDASEGSHGLAYDAYHESATLADALTSHAAKLGGFVIGNRIVVDVRDAVAAEQAIKDFDENRE